MFHLSFYDAPRTGVNFFAMLSFHLSARVGESLANCLSIFGGAKVQVTGHRLQVTGHGSQVTGRNKKLLVNL